MSRRRHRPGRVALVLSLAAVTPLAAASLAQADDPATQPPAATDVPATPALDSLGVTTEQLTDQLARPTAIAGPDDGSGQLFITEQEGTVQVYDPDGGLADEPLLDISDLVEPDSNEQGLLGIATADDFADTQEVYLAYTALPDGDVTLARHNVAQDSHEILIEQEHPEFTNHNGGQLAFGAGGHLFWSLGDGGGGGDPHDNAQDNSTLLGKIVRIDVTDSCDGLPYCVPEDNPFVEDDDARSEIWTTGVRNAWKFSIDPADDSLWIADVGQDAWEEINHLAADDAGANLGWPCYEGFEVYDAERCVDGASYTDPIFTYATRVDGCAVIGGEVYRGSEYADLADGVYIASDYCSATVFALQETGEGEYAEAQIGELPEQVAAIGTDADGELYTVTDRSGELHSIGFAEAGTD